MLFKCTGVAKGFRGSGIVQRYSIGVTQGYTGTGLVQGYGSTGM